MKPESTRNGALRELLVDRVQQTPRRPLFRRPVLGLVVAFAAGALLTGGALSAAAVVGTRMSNYDTLRSAEAGGRSILGTHDPIVGAPFELVADGDAWLDVGAQPGEATALFLATACVGEGELSVAVDGDWYLGATCDEEGGGFGTHAQVTVPSDSHEIAVKIIQGSARYAVWAAWVVVQQEPEPSAEQSAALADGVVTYDEYLAGWDRYAACLLDAGFDIGRTPGNSPGVPGEAVDSGVDMVCYVSEFEELDMEWQLNGG